MTLPLYHDDLFINMAQQSASEPTPKMTVICRVEPGCLGPEGHLYIEDFCLQAQPLFGKIGRQYIAWQIVPRYDKKLPEIQYQLHGRNVPRDKADTFLRYHQHTLEQFEERINELLSTLIDIHLGRHGD